MRGGAAGIRRIRGKFPGGKFRTLRLPTACAGTGSNIVAAWADYRDGVSHIYYRRSTNGGDAWLGGASGTRLLTGAHASAANQHEFHPQLMAAPSGDAGFAFFSFCPHGRGCVPSSFI